MELPVLLVLFVWFLLTGASTFGNFWKICKGFFPLRSPTAEARTSQFKRSFFSEVQRANKRTNYPLMFSPLVQISSCSSLVLIDFNNFSPDFTFVAGKKFEKYGKSEIFLLHFYVNESLCTKFQILLTHFFLEFVLEKLRAFDKNWMEYIGKLFSGMYMTEITLCECLF